MSEATHTPGPWKVCNNMDGDLCIGTDEDEPWFVAEMCLGAQGCDVEVEPAPANARLIAAAPDMKQDGQFLLDRLSELQIPKGLYRDWAGHVEPAIARFRAALERAEPKSAA